MPLQGLGTMEDFLLGLLITTGILVCMAIMICCHCRTRKRSRLPSPEARETGQHGSSEAGLAQPAVVVSPVLWSGSGEKPPDSILTVSEVVTQQKHARRAILASVTTVADVFHQCPVCVEPYDLKDRLPKILSCQHTLCQICVSRLIQMDADQAMATLVCPECRSTQRTAWGGLALMPNNLTMVRYIDYTRREPLQTVTHL